MVCAKCGSFNGTTMRQEGLTMSDELKGLYRFGGISLIISGVLVFLKSLLNLMAGSPPSSGAEILAWRTSEELPLALISAECVS
jgi:hypothetical protein